MPIFSFCKYRQPGLGGSFLLLFSLAAQSAHASVSQLQVAGVSDLKQDLSTLSLDFSYAGLRYATEQDPISRLTLSAGWRAPDGVAEIQLHSFFETGAKADRSFDIDQTVIRPRLLRGGHLWLGRVHPLRESEQGMGLRHTSAIGSHWVQNQSNALSPRVAGWIGIGIHQPMGDTGFNYTLAYSPVFIPTFGPARNFSEDEETTGARFARLPPSIVEIQTDTTLPLRYRIETGNLRDLVLQNQVFGAVTHSTGVTSASLFAWSAPDPDPQTEVSGVLNVNEGEQEVKVLVVARPRFPRQNFYGGRLRLSVPNFEPELEMVREARSGLITLSAAVRFLNVFSMGGLHTLAGEGAAGSVGPESIPSSPNYAHRLLWGEVSGRITARLSGRLRYERHLSRATRGEWLSPSLELRAAERLRLFATANILTGVDRSWFGEWRANDSVGMGARIVW